MGEKRENEKARRASQRRTGDRRGNHEQRFMERMTFCGPGVPSVQEVSMPRKARRLDLVMTFTVAPSWFGALQNVCHQRVVLFEHLSRRARRHDVASARVGEAWLAWEQVRPVARGRSEPREAWRSRSSAMRAPLAVVVADGAQADLHGAVPMLRSQPAAGVWATPNLEEGGLIVLDTTRVQADEGYAWWSWLGRARSDEEAAERLFRLLGDDRISTLERERLKEAVVEGELETSEIEREGLYKRLQREIRESRDEGLALGFQKGHAQGLQEGLGQGIERGIERGIEKAREALLRLAASVAPEDLAELRALEDLDALERAVTERVLRGR